MLTLTISGRENVPEEILDSFRSVASIIGLVVLAGAVVSGMLTGGLVLTSMTAGAALVQHLQLAQFIAKSGLPNFWLGDLVESSIASFSEKIEYG